MVIAKNPKIKEYINSVCAKIQNREIHQEIKLELETHFNDTIQEYLSAGLSENEAVCKAIEQMGNADLVGKKLNEVHKPKPEWSILVIGFLFMTLNIAAMFLMGKQGLFTVTTMHFFIKSLVFTVSGIFIIIGLYLFDYRKLEPYSKYIYLCCLMLLAYLSFYGPHINGKSYLNIGLLYIDFIGISPFIFSIALAGILNNWDWQQPKKLIKGLLICILPLILILLNNSLSVGMIYLACCITLAATSGARIGNTLLLISLVSGISILPIVYAPYRLQSLFSFINPEKDPSGSGWLNLQLSKLISSSGLFGKGFSLKPQSLPNLHTEFIFSYITYTFGWIAAAVLIACIILFIYRLLKITIHVKNNYGKLLISGFIAVFSVQFLWNIFMNIGLAPITGISLPFISYGGSQLLFNAGLLGIISSIYRRRNISLPFIK